MAFDLKGFRLQDYGGTIGIGNTSVVATAQYVTNDDRAAVEGTGYFNAVARQVPKGSVIHCSIDLDGTPELLTYLVSANTGTVVTIVRSKAAAAS